MGGILPPLATVVAVQSNDIWVAAQALLMFCSGVVASSPVVARARLVELAVVLSLKAYRCRERIAALVVAAKMVQETLSTNLTRSGGFVTAYLSES